MWLTSKGILGGLVTQVRLGKLVAKLSKFAFEGRSLIYAGMFGIGNLELVILKHLKVLVETLGRGLLRFVLIIQVFKLAHSDRATIDRHQHGIGLDLCGGRQHQR